MSCLDRKDYCLSGVHRHVKETFSVKYTVLGLKKWLHQDNFSYKRPKGVDKSIKTTGSRTRLNIVGAIRLGYLSEAVIEQYHKTVNGESIVDFLTKTRQLYHTNGTIHLVLDGVGYHRSALVVDAAKELNITLHYLPLYSPNLNPIGRLWKVMNKYARNSQYFATTKEFRERIDRFFTTTLPEITYSLDSTINENCQKLIPVF